ncbi:hypothetical protein P154DRAFT_540816 [Amniculicola lignicola CBS 123094]|uniref:Uncharacterized protein n=1 Tax=Amniculicola lignicola CBS 123094 TaxID=1392246 RepID=A0A6A5VVD2_9PLEO|nr:hypothetical protein P154DRAFT_540816 [Amniculicola lignicola CBS 123094]
MARDWYNCCRGDVRQLGESVVKPPTDKRDVRSLCEKGVVECQVQVDLKQEARATPILLIPISNQVSAIHSDTPRPRGSPKSTFQRRGARSGAGSLTVEPPQKRIGHAALRSQKFSQQELHRFQAVPLHKKTPGQSLTLMPPAQRLDPIRDNAAKQPSKLSTAMDLPPHKDSGDDDLLGPSPDNSEDEGEPSRTLGGRRLPRAETQDLDGNLWETR